MSVIPAPLTLDPGKAEADFGFLLGTFREVLTAAGEGVVADALPWAGAAAHGHTADPVRLTQALSIAFRLAHLAEENASAQHRRHLQSDAGLDAVSGLWGRVIADLAASGVDPGDAAAKLARVWVEPVLTAHPTEAKRATVLECHRDLYVQLVARENQMWTPAEQSEIKDEVATVLERLWRTGDIFLERPGIADELRNVLHYLTRVFPEVIPRLDARLRSAWAAAGFDPMPVGDATRLPRLTFGTWVGGDRDGHPLVTADVTRQTLSELRRHALQLADSALGRLASRLSLSDRLQAPSPAMVDWINDMSIMLGPAGSEAVERNPSEPWRQAVNLMRKRLPYNDAGVWQAGVWGSPSRGHAGTPGRYLTAAELVTDLVSLADWLTEVGAGRVARREVDPVIRRTQTFGFHLASLDVRQNSRFHDEAIAQLLTAAGIPGGESFGDWDETARLDLLHAELASSRPLARPDIGVGDRADAVLAVYRVLRDEISAHGADGVGSLIVSMTRKVSDLLAVYLLAKEAGLWAGGGEDGACPIPVVPLFETIDDLRESPGILASFLGEPITQRTLGLDAGESRPTQQVMVGYSDSNKDGGIVASLWGLYRAEQNLAAVGDEAGVALSFFHGRGGTIARGAGPTHRFLRALPPGSLSGKVRITEQGETISQKYANLVTAEYHLELLVAGTAAAVTSPAAGHDRFRPLEPVMDAVSIDARRSYVDLVSSEGFVEFFRQATPIDVIEAANIGSRPARRTGQATVADLRAIPWVFSWSQARFSLSGWYGLGSALAAARESDPEVYGRLSAAVFDWPPLHYIVSNVATAIAGSDPEIMAAYAGLVEDADLRDRFLARILEERDRTVAVLSDIYGGPLDVQRPNIARTLELRRPGLEVLHRRQVDGLRTWRALTAVGDPAARPMLDGLLLTVNAIASGLDATG